MIGDRYAGLWAVFEMTQWGEMLCFTTVRTRRKDAIAAYLDLPDGDPRARGQWRELARRGDVRVAKIEVKEV
jgi:hypothetical protein